MSDLFSLQGRFSSAIRDSVTGQRGALTWLGNVSVASLALEIETSEKNESFSGTRALYGSVQRSKTARLTMTLDEWLPENLALGLYGTLVEVGGGHVTAEVFPGALIVGSQVQLDQRFVSDVVLVDSAGSPATLIAGTDYKVLYTSGGVIEIIDPTGFVQPFKAAYDYADAKSLALLSAVTAPRRWINFDGVNTITGEKVVVDLYDVQFNPITQFDLINDEWGGMAMEAVAFYDPINALDEELGGFGRLMTHNPATQDLS